MLKFQCFLCKNYSGLAKCKAFPKRIPDEILEKFDHTKPYKGDNGIRFEEFVNESYNENEEGDDANIDDDTEFDENSTEPIGPEGIMEEEDEVDTFDELIDILGSGNIRRRFTTIVRK